MVSIQLQRWHIAVFLYIISVLLLIAFKPPIMFTERGEPKVFASKITDSTSVFAPSLVIPLLGFMSYFIAAIIEMIFI